jgi:molybdate transport system substrate-binding protein
VMGENISQAAQFAQSGNADVGLLALSLALAPALKSVGHYAAVPDSMHPPIEQAGIVVATSGNNELARKFLDSLKRPEIVKILESYGFSLRR